MKGSSVLSVDLPLAVLKFGSQAPYRIHSLSLPIIPFPRDDHTGGDGGGNGLVTASGKANRSFFF